MAERTVEGTEVAAQLPQVRVAVLGAGKMGGILLQAFLKQNLFCTGADSRHRGPRRAGAGAEYAVGRGRDHQQPGGGAAVGSDSAGREADAGSGLVEEIRPALTTAKTLISFAASVKTARLKKRRGWRSRWFAPCPIRPRRWGRGRRRCAADAL